MPNTHTTLSELFTDIADAIREKSGDSGTIKADDFPSEIANIQGGGVTVTPFIATENGIYVAPEGTAYSPVHVKTPTPKNVYTATVEPSGYGVLEVTCGFLPKYIAVSPRVPDGEVAPEGSLIGGIFYYGRESVIYKGEEYYEDTDTHIDDGMDFFETTSTGFTFGLGDMPFVTNQFLVIATD